MPRVRAAAHLEHVRRRAFFYKASRAARDIESRGSWMDVDPLSPVSLGYVAFRFGYVVLGVLGLLSLWRRPRATAAFWLLVALNLATWAACVAPLGRLYGLSEHLDRSFWLGMTATAATGHSPFEHTQVGFANLEPLWSALTAALALYRPENAAAVWFWLSPVSIVMVAAGLFFGMRATDADDDAWERLLVVFAVLGLSSFSLSQRAPVPPLWSANFLLKPNHAAGFAMVGIVLGLRARARSPLAVGLALGALAWVFFLHWAYVLLGLVAGALLWRAAAAGRAVAGASGVSLLLAAPYIRHLTRDHNPLAEGDTPRQLWLDVTGVHLAVPHWATLDLGVLFLLGMAGALVLHRRALPRDRDVLGLLAAVWLLWLGYELAAPFGISPEPEELHYFLRFAMALAAGGALFAAARALERWRPLRPGQAPLALMALLLPLTFPASWDPPLMDRYFRWCRPPLRPKVVAYGRWVRENTPKDAVFVAGNEACIWIPGLAGRRVLLTGASRPPRDYEARKQAERTLLLSREPEQIRETARRFGVDYLAIDREMLLEYGEESLEGLGQLPVYEMQYRSSAVRIFKIRR